ncbi:voltage-gated potassium channel [Aureococcus anophagefferens]|nr:voltage-gated potassium channel [Aureococcus anophagefferens]
MDDGVDLLDAHLRSLRYTVSAAALRGADPGRLEAQCSSIDAGVGGLGRLRDDFVRLIDGALGAERPGAPADDARSAPPRPARADGETFCAPPRADDKRAKGTVAPGARPRRPKNGASAGPQLVKSIFQDCDAGPLQRQRNKSTMSREQRRISELHAELQDMGLQIARGAQGGEVRGQRARKHVITFKMRIRAVYEDAGLPTGAKARVVGLLDKLGRSAPEYLVEETLAEERVDSGSSAAMFGKEQIINLAWKRRRHGGLRIEGDPFNGWCGMRLLSPTEEAVQYFDLMITAALIYVFASLPLCLAFEEINERLYVNFFCDLFFCLDVVKNLHMGYQDATGTLLLELADESSDNKILSSKKALKVLKLARMTKLVKLLRASQLVKKVRNVARELLEYYQVHVSDTTMKLLRLFVAMLLLTHWGSCMLILLVRTYNYPRLSWAVLWELLEAGSGRPWRATTTGWCLIESWTTLVGMFLGCIFNAYAVASFTAMIVASNVSTQEFEQLLRTNEYMRSLHLPSELRDRIREYYHHRWHEGKIFDETLILERLNPELCMEILAYKIRELVPKVPILRTASKRFSELLAKSMDPQVYVEGECVVSEGERGDTLYFIDKGLCEILVAAVANEVVRVLGDGCFFGEGAAEDFENTIAEYPDVSSYVERIAKRRVERIQQLHINARLSNGTELMDAEDDEDVRTPLFRAANTRAHNLGRTTKMHETPAVPLGHMGKTAAFNRFKTAMLGVAPGAK